MPFPANRFGNRSSNIPPTLPVLCAAALSTAAPLRSPSLWRLLPGHLVCAFIGISGRDEPRGSRLPLAVTEQLSRDVSASTKRALRALSRIARAQAYPTRPVRIIVGFAPAGGTDIMARLIGQWLSERLDQQFVIENRPGLQGAQ
jgi:hypothetical protein